MINPLAGKWVKQELLIKVHSTDGSIYFIENNGAPDNGFSGPAVNYKGPTDIFPGTSRSAGLGGYARSNNSLNNRRFFADIYMDTAAQRVILANSPNYSNATIVEPQIPTLWTDSAITMTGNLGQFPNSGTAYLFIFDGNNQRNQVGYPVNLGP